MKCSKEDFLWSNLDMKNKNLFISDKTLLIFLLIKMKCQYDTKSLEGNY